MEQARPKLFLIDAYSLLFRAHLAYGGRESLRTTDGRPTGALFGFTGMLLSILREKPDAIYVAWDAPGPTFRDELFEAYKAHRPEPDPDLKAQFQPARQIVEALGIPSAEVPGYEADDLIGSLAEAGCRAGYDVVIYTGDSDQLQLVQDHVTVRMTGRGVSETTDYDPDAVFRRYGVRPEQFADFKALVGDTSDNIPGVPGVGEVTAAKLLQQWGDLENLLQHIDELPEKKATEAKVKAALRDHAERVRLGKQLTTIRTDVPIEEPVRNYTPDERTWSRVKQLFEDLEFRTYLRRLPELTGLDSAEDEASSPMLPPLECREVIEPHELENLLQQVRQAGQLAVRFQLRNDPSQGADILAVAVALDPSRAYYIPVMGEKPTRGLLGVWLEMDGQVIGPEDIRRLLEETRCRLIVHDAKSVFHLMARLGWHSLQISFDTALAAYLLSPGSDVMDLATLAGRYLKVAEAPTTTAREQLCHEAAWMAALAPIFEQRLVRDGLERVFHELEMPLVQVLADMEQKGVLVDSAALRALSADLEARLAELERQIYDLAGERFLISSPQQLQRILFDKLKLPAGRKTKTGRTTSADHLEALAGEYPIARLILQYREISKLKSTYADALPKLIRKDTGRLHTKLNQMVTSTGRLSSSDPNLQNIPVRTEEGRRIRKAFVAPPGRVLLSCDYSQIELRVFAHVTGDAELVRAFEADEDIHTATATRLFGVPADEVTADMRRRAKTVNFAVIYGQSPYGLSQTLGIPTEEAKKFIENYFKQFPGVKAWTDWILNEARERGYVETLMGRRRYLPDLRSGNRNLREAAERAAVNMPIQGTAADIMKQAMLRVWQDQKQNKRPWDLVLQVHDELLFEVDEHALKEAVEVVANCMSTAFQLNVPLKVDARAGLNWAELEPVSV